MKCILCGKHKPTFKGMHFRRYINGKERRRYVCPNCIEAIRKQPWKN